MKYKKIFLFVIIIILILFSIKHNIHYKISSVINLDYKDCLIIQNKLAKRTQPFSFEKEFLFIASLISCKIPFSFIRFGDGENSIMKGIEIKTKNDNWSWDIKNKKFRERLIESSSICSNTYNFISIPCKNWIETSKSILSFSNCTSSKFMSYATLFINKNYILFKEWIIRFLENSNRWKIILVVNSNINKNISWAYKYYPVPDKIVENWEEISTNLMPNLENEAKQNKLIFFISAGPAANIIILLLHRINNSNIYIDFGSSIEFITKGYSTRNYSNKTNKHSKQKCTSFQLINNELHFKL